MNKLSHKRVTVTGGAGFLGSYVAEKLYKENSLVSIPRSAYYDLTLVEDTRNMYLDYQPEILIHLAAKVGGIGANQNNPGEFFHDNMAMGLNVIEQGRIYGGLEKLVIIGTTCSYPKYTQTPFKEEHVWDGFPEETNAPYGIAKRALLSMAWGYRSQYGMNIIYLIPANLYGPGDNFDPANSHVIPALIRKITEAKEQSEPQVVAWGTGKPTREFLYAEDAAEGIVKASTLYDNPAPLNLGTGVEVSIKDLADHLSSLINYSGSITWDETKPDGQPRRCLDVSSAKAEVGFEAKTPLAFGLMETVQWYMTNRELVNHPGDKSSDTQG